MSVKDMIAKLDAAKLREQAEREERERVAELERLKAAEQATLRRIKEKVPYLFPPPHPPFYFAASCLHMHCWRERENTCLPPPSPP